MATFRKRRDIFLGRNDPATGQRRPIDEQSMHLMRQQLARRYLQGFGGDYAAALDQYLADHQSTWQEHAEDPSSYRLQPIDDDTFRSAHENYNWIPEEDMPEQHGLTDEELDARWQQIQKENKVPPPDAYRHYQEGTNRPDNRPLKEKSLSLSQIKSILFQQSKDIKSLARKMKMLMLAVPQRKR